MRGGFVAVGIAAVEMADGKCRDCGVFLDWVMVGFCVYYCVCYFHGRSGSVSN